MNRNGLHDGQGVSQPLVWTGRLLSADDLHRNLNGQREVVLAWRTIVTPLALDQLRAGGVVITRQDKIVDNQAPKSNTAWGVALDQPDPQVQAAVRSLEKDEAPFMPLPPRESTPWAWARAIAGCIVRGDCQGGVVFCADPGLACCVANKVPGLRAAVVLSALQVRRTLASLGPNFLAVENPGRTYFEIRQILKSVRQTSGKSCPPELARTLEELDRHAHR